MGGCFSSSAIPDERTRQAEQVMREAKKSLQNYTKVLLLGTGDSGKSTILKQIRLINQVPFSPEEVEGFRHVIFSNLITSMIMLYDIIEDESLDLDCSDDIRHLFASIQAAPDISAGKPYPAEYLGILQNLWNDASVQKAVLFGANLALPDNVTYFFDNLPRLFAPDYIPTQQDILHSRVRTTGVSETQFVFEKRTVSVIDVGGQRSERRKWIHCFQDVTAILFLVSLSGYDQTLTEDRQTNQMLDAMTVWESICASPWFERTNFILFLNKEDLFKQKIIHSTIRRFFPDFDGVDGDYQAGEKYFKRRFTFLHNKGIQTLKSTVDSPNRPKIPIPSETLDIRKLYTYFTTATDTDMVRKVMASVNDIILMDNLANSFMV